MKRAHKIAVAAGVVVAVGGAAFAAQEAELPTFLKADEQLPVKQPESFQKVAVLQVVLTSQGERVEAQIESQRVVNSAGPKSVARSAGDWEVRVLGKTKLVYQIPNPLRDIETENPDDDRQPFASVDEPTYNWTLIVPLYSRGESLGAETIEVVDLVTGATILSTPVRD